MNETYSGYERPICTSVHAANTTEPRDSHTNTNINAQLSSAIRASEISADKISTSVICNKETRTCTISQKQ